MKTENKSWLVSAGAVGLILITLGTSAWANEGSSAGTRGGGETVRVGGRERLVDLVPEFSGACVRAPMMWDLIREEATAVEALDALIDNQIFLRLAIEGEARRLPVCITQASLQRLQRSTTRAGDIVITTQSLGGRQAAVRVLNGEYNDTVFLSSLVFRSLSPTDRGMLLIHEVLQRFVSPTEGIADLNSPERKRRLRNLVAAIERNRHRRISASEMSNLLSISGANFPTHDDRRFIRRLQYWARQSLDDQQRTNWIAFLLAWLPRFLPETRGLLAAGRSPLFPGHWRDEYLDDLYGSYRYFRLVLNWRFNNTELTYGFRHTHGYWIGFLPESVEELLERIDWLIEQIQLGSFAAEDLSSIIIVSIQHREDLRDARTRYYHFVPSRLDAALSRLDAALIEAGVIQGDSRGNAQ